MTRYLDKQEKVEEEKDIIYPGYERFINREISWLDFNERILYEASDPMTPLLERLSFLSITQTNQDEFVSVRVAGLKEQVKNDDYSRDIAGLTAHEQLKALSQKMHNFVKGQYKTYNKNIIPALENENVFIQNFKNLATEQREFVYKFFKNKLYPILTPMAVDQGRPFPLLPNESQNIAVLLESEDYNEEEGGEQFQFATVQVPVGISRLLKLPNKQFAEERGLDDRETHCYILLEDIIYHYIDELFSGYKILAKLNYRIIRNADMSIDEAETSDLLEEIQKKLYQRQWGEVIRLEIRSDFDISLRILAMLQDFMGINQDDIYQIPGPLDLAFLGKLSRNPELDYKSHLHYPPYKPQKAAMLAGEDMSDIFSKIREKDVFLSLPYEKFDPVLEFVKQAARDPKVLAIKQTLYRVSSNSPIIHYLEEAVKNGKQVLVLLELKARFDEGNNIEWAKKLERAGAHVIYGLVGLKTHSKITMVVREEEDGIRRYVHLGTGNYNDSTAKIYTDTGIFTSADAYGSDATEFFNMISGYSEPNGFKKLLVAPRYLRSSFYDLIDREIINAKAGKSAWIIAKMNSLVDEGIIKKLHEANAAGVKIQLIVRGICCLKTGIPGISDNIQVKSIVGKYLEHSRIYVFANADDPEYYMGSADWMDRNLDRRVEIIFPVEAEAVKDRVKEIIDLQLNDTERSFIMQADGSYKKFRSQDNPIDSQAAQQILAIDRSGESENDKLIEPFKVAENPDLDADLQEFSYSSFAEEFKSEIGEIDD